MHTVIIALLVVIVLVLLGLFLPLLYGVVLSLVAVAPKLLVVGGVFLVCLVGLLAYHAANGTL